MDFLSTLEKTACFRKREKKGTRKVAQGPSKVDGGLTAKQLQKRLGIHVSGFDAAAPLADFDDLKEHPCGNVLVRNIQQCGYERPTPIQRQLMPVMIAKQECFATSATGSGKTLAFLAPMLLHSLQTNSDSIVSVVVSPTNELATQIYHEALKLSQGTQVDVQFLDKRLFEGIKKTKRPCTGPILISTPLRLSKLIDSNLVDLSHVAYLIFDEGDSLFQPKFLGPVDSILHACSNASITRALVSATMSPNVEELASTVLRDPLRIVVGQKNATCSDVEQELVFTSIEEGKLHALKKYFSQGIRCPALIFVQSKERAKELYDEIKDNAQKIPVGIIHSDQYPHQRKSIVTQFRKGTVWVLICTELLSRGLDFRCVDCVINYDFPQTTSSYIHRVGRTGRAGRPGKAITFFSQDDADLLRSIANVMKISGCPVPEWMLQLAPISRKRRKELEQKPPARRKIGL